MCLIWNSAHWISNLGLLVDERADVVEVPLLDGQHVGSEAELYFQGKHPPSENLVSDMNTFPICRGPGQDDRLPPLILFFLLASFNIYP